MGLLLKNIHLCSWGVSFLLYSFIDNRCLSLIRLYSFLLSTFKKKNLNDFKCTLHLYLISTDVGNCLDLQNFQYQCYE